MSTDLLQCDSTNMLVLYKAEIIIIGSRCNLLLPLYSWKNYSLGFQ